MSRSVFPAFFCLLLCAASGSAETFEQLAARATSARDANDIPRALAAYRQALQVKPDWAEGWWFLGTLAYDADQYQQGRDAFAHFVKLDANAAPGWSLLGLCEFETGEPSAALEHIQRGLRLSAGSQNDMEEVLRFHEAMLLTRTGLFDQALGKYIWFARRGIHNPQLLVAIGMAALRQPLLPKDLTGDGPDAAAAAGAAAYAWMGSNFHDADESFRVLGANGAATEGLYAVGPLTRGAVWEAVAVPDLRVHTATVARTMLADLKRKGEAADGPPASPVGAAGEDRGP